MNFIKINIIKLQQKISNDHQKFPIGDISDIDSAQKLKNPQKMYPKI